MVGQVLHGLTILEVLGAGKFGTVYRATTQEGQERAVKVLHPHWALNPDVVRRFIEEGEILRQLAHPNIIKLYHAGEEGGVYFMELEYAPGGNLENFGRQFDKTAAPPWFPPAKIIELMNGICSAVQFLQEKGYIHRDIKPSNLVFSGSGIIKLADFGIARIMDISPACTIAGTEGFSAPEQLEGRGVGKTADIYAIGANTLWMLFGKDLKEMPPSDMKAFIPSRPEIAGLVRTALTAAASLPQRRFQSAAEMAQALSYAGSVEGGGRVSSRVVGDAGIRRAESSRGSASLAPDPKITFKQYFHVFLEKARPLAALAAKAAAAVFRFLRDYVWPRCKVWSVWGAAFVWRQVCCVSRAVFEAASSLVANIIKPAIQPAPSFAADAAPRKRFNLKIPLLLILAALLGFLWRFQQHSVQDKWEKEKAQVSYFITTARDKFHSGKYLLAAENYSRAAVYSPEDADLHAKLGLSYYLGNLPYESVEALEKAVRLAPENAQYRILLGKSLSALKRPSEAAVAYKRALRIEPDNREARRLLAALN